MKLVSNVSIDHIPDNLSDHLPVLVVLELNLKNSITIKPEYPPAGINWQKINEPTKEHYGNKMKECLDSIHVPFHSLLHGNNTCDCDDHLIAIEKYFSDITIAISNAQSYLPRSRPGTY